MHRKSRITPSPETARRELALKGVPYDEKTFIDVASSSFGAFAYTQSQSSSSRNTQKEKVVTKHAKGTFEVKMNPQAAENNVGDATIGRMALDKKVHGELEAASEGQMLAAMTDVQGSAGYVALERVNGTLGGHKGTFALQHSGTMNRGAAALTITVVSDSGTG